MITLPDTTTLTASWIVDEDGTLILRWTTATPPAEEHEALAA
jgi:hypothetical protein